MRLLADECVETGILTALRHAGFDVTAVDVLAPPTAIQQGAARRRPFPT